MMKRQNICVACLACLIFFCACNRGKDSAIILGFDNLNRVVSFEYSKALLPDSTFKADKYFADFAICDSFVCTGSGAWDVRVLPDWKSMKSLFVKGHANGEFTLLPEVYNSSFIHEDNELCAVVYDMGNGNVYKANITKLITTDSICIEKIKHKLKKSLDRYLYINSNEFVTRENTHDFRPKKLTHYIDNKKVPNKYFERLDAIETGTDDYNVLAALEGYNINHNVIVQAYVYFNIINIIPLDDSGKAVTICYGDEGIAINEVVKAVEKKRFFYEIRIYEDYFAVLCLKNLERPTVQLYSYDGNPLKEFVLNKPSTSFDIDWIDHCLYTHNEEDETITRYKIEL